MSTIQETISKIKKVSFKSKPSSKEFEKRHLNVDLYEYCRSTKLLLGPIGVRNRLFSDCKFDFYNYWEGHCVLQHGKADRVI